MTPSGRSTFDDELALERIEAELATELPAHVRAFATAYAAGQPAPPPPDVVRRPSTIDISRRLLRDAQRVLATRRLGSVEAELRARVLNVLRLAMPVAIEDNSAVAAARTAPRSWDAWNRLVAARNAVSRARFGGDHVALMHALHGCASGIEPSSSPQEGSRFALSRHRHDGLLDREGISSTRHDNVKTESKEEVPKEEVPKEEETGREETAGWHEPAPEIAPPFVERAWRDLAIWHGARGTCRIVRAAARPRAFVVEPGREVIVVIGAIDTPAMRFAALHELGHAVAALIVPHVLARVVDEAVAAYVARLLEHEGVLDLAWYTPIATAARIRRDRLSRALDAVERSSAESEIATPPWSLWHDPGVQAAYVEAEVIAERWWAELGATPAAGALAAAITVEQQRIDQAGSALIT